MASYRIPPPPAPPAQQPPQEGTERPRPKAEEARLALRRARLSVHMRRHDGPLSK